jgi:hypothetical protein
MQADNLILEKFENAASNAHRNTSFSPELRGKQMIVGYSEELSNDIAELKADNEVTEEQINDYISRYEKFFGGYLSAKSRCFSVMITGSSNFPVRRHEKANRSESKHYEIFREWRSRAKKAIVRKAKPVKTYASELERYEAELTSLKAKHELTKEANKKIFKSRKTGEDITQYLIDNFKVQPHMMADTLKWGFYTVNSNASIKRIEHMIKTIQQKQLTADTKGNQERNFEGGKIVFNYEIDRLQLVYDSKPQPETITLLKKNGFKWSPTQTAWQRQLTQNAVWAVKHNLKIQAA